MANTKVKAKLTNTEIQQRGFCNWCRNPLSQTTETFSSSNLVDSGKKFASGATAYAVYCSDCLADSFRTSQPKSVVNTDTMDEINIEDLPGLEVQRQLAKEREETLKATGTKEMTEAALEAAKATTATPAATTTTSKK